jgi:ribosomal protein S18 acetylase RimI-like enzyme
MVATIRTLELSEFPLLEEFLYHAIFVSEGSIPPPKDVIYQSDLLIYIEDFGKKFDYAFVAEQEGEVVGMAWARLIKAYGYLDDDTPELAMSVLPEHRSKGIGTQLLARLLDLLCERGFERVSLSVQKNNPAVRLYERFAFQTVSENKDDYLMVKIFPPESMED